MTQADTQTETPTEPTPLVKREWKTQSVKSIEANIKRLRTRLAETECHKPERQLDQIALEIEQLESRLAAVNDLRKNQANTKATREAFGELVSEISDLKDQAKDRRNRILYTISEHQRCADQIAKLEQAKVYREAQEKRLKGGILSRLTRTGSKTHYYDESIELIADLCRTANTSKVSPEYLEDVYKRLDAEYQKAKNDLALWVEENEVADYHIRPVHYEITKVGEWTTSVLYRAIDNLQPTHSGIVEPTSLIDNAAWLYQTVLSPSSCEKILTQLGCKNARQDMNRLYFVIDPVTEQVQGKGIITIQRGPLL